ncbi:Polysaccharide deacetylase [Lishizhenia tianjinensis]|uniref:Polysaccharide deacetylase n=1 Tax=Lishizhenia tianjinensis TaxID=477690 RepID=A0A1I6XDV0_9FLAO|nr:polysaccharide deacetylase family protein [Lishizhenia tianjinensis]SFT36377.1 Polysaccharide deacetylase [Lishizhenia tianjinensis]
MNIFLTLDYELFFGNPTGSVEKCILEPTERLLNISRKYGVGMTYFVDIGYLLAMEREMIHFPQLQHDYNLVVDQLHKIIAEGSDVQLHIHPHWEDCNYTPEGWNMITHLHYKLDDFPEEEIYPLVKRYKEKLEEIIGRKVNSFRAGGWCLQPFSKVEKAFQELGIKYDTTVFQGGKFSSEHYAFDFTSAPNKGRYQFQSVLTHENPEGYFTEIPIGGMKYHPLFYWQLYGWGRVRPSRHKMLGDGNFIAQPGRKQKHLTKSSWNHISMDGYFASKLKSATRKFAKSGRTDLVVIGHPKSMTEFSFERLERYIQAMQKKHEFLTFKDLPHAD